MDQKGWIEWLMTNGSPVVQYRTAVELADEPGAYNQNQLASNLIKDPHVLTWLRKTPQGIHGSDDYFETILLKLIRFGFRAGMEPMDQFSDPYRKMLEKGRIDRYEPYDHYHGMMITNLLAYAGYAEAAVLDRVHQRLELVYEFVRQERYDLYLEPEQATGAPPAWRHMILRPDLYNGWEARFPWLHDVYGFSALNQHSTETERSMVEAVIRWMLSNAYHAIDDRYGYLKLYPGRYKAMGWKMNLPGYPDLSHLRPYDKRTLVQRVIELSVYHPVREHPWFDCCLNHLKGYRMEQGTYLFPAEYLREASGYSVFGMHMGLGGFPRNRQVIEMESTFWMLWIEKKHQSSVGR